MYLEHFGLNAYPFSLTPDTQYYVNQKTHKEALNTLFLALEGGQGFIKIVGEVGTGKTLLCRILLSHLSKKNYVSVYIPNPWMAPEELKAHLAHEIGAVYERTMGTHELTSSIYRRLMQLTRQNKPVVIIIDEAQTMPRDTLESLRLLTNLETEKSKLLQVVMFGQPELDALLLRDDMRQLRQRIVFSENIKPLSLAAIEHYLISRMKESGYKGDKTFNRGAVWLLYQAAGGIPRLLNILAHKSLMCGYGKGDTEISGWHVARAIADTPASKNTSRALSLLWLIGNKGRASRVLEPSQ